MSAYIDTSVLGAYYCPEELSGTVDRALGGIEGPTISALSEVEFYSLIAKKRRLKQLTKAHGLEILELFATHVSEGFYRRISLTAEHYAKARQLIVAPGAVLHTLEALQLAVALAAGLPLMTADRQLALAARRHRCKVRLLR